MRKGFNVEAPARRLRVIVENSPGVWRYVAKIIPYGKRDGGGFALVPAYMERKGYVCKIKVTDTFSHTFVPPQPAMFDGCTISQRIKLSFHADGATQISGADSGNLVTSGRDFAGAFKGMGILGRPFSNPVLTGGIFSITIWGLQHYPRSTVKKDTIQFSRIDLGKRRILTGDAIILSGYLVKRTDGVNHFFANGEHRVLSRRWNGGLGIKENMELRVCNLHNEHSFLAIDCIRMSHVKADRKPSGYMLSSQRDKDNVGIHAFYPPPKFVSAYRTLDRGFSKPKIIKPLGY